MRDRVYIVLLNYNGWQDTVICLESILKLNYMDYRIIICDTSPSNESETRIKNWINGNFIPKIVMNRKLKELVYPFVEKPIENEFIHCKIDNVDAIYARKKLTFIGINKNIGFSAGNNVGIKVAMKDEKCKFIWLLNNDTVVEKDALINLVRTMNGNSRLGGVGSVLMKYEDPDTVQCIGGYVKKIGFKIPPIAGGKSLGALTKKDFEKVKIISGASVLLGIPFIKDLGGELDTSYFLFFEELDLYKRAEARKWLLKAVSNSIVYHKSGGSTQNESDYFVRYHGVRSKYIALKKYYKYLLLYIMVLDFFRILYALIIDRNISRAILNGMIDGIAYTRYK